MKTILSTVEYSSWETPASKYPRAQLGVAKICDYKMPKGIYHMYKVDGYDLFNAINPINTTNLRIRGKVWMTDDPPHWRAMVEHAKHYHGHVLCAGLGLGLIVHALNANPAVTKIDVIEKERDVINLIGPHLPKGKLEIIHEDFWSDWDARPDGIFYDLFVGSGRELYPQAMRVWFQLHERFPGTVRRIHGFNNEQFASLDSLIERL